MKYPEGQKQATHDKIVATASRMFRERGVRATTVPDVMKDAGLTVGGFYKHFDSKDALFREALAAAMQRSGRMMAMVPEDLRGDDFLRAASSVYLTMEHREAVAKGCALAALSVDVARSDDETRQIFEDALTKTIDGLATRLDEGDRDAAVKRAWHFFASIMGGLILARSVASDDTANTILEGCREWIAPKKEPKI